MITSKHSLLYLVVCLQNRKKNRVQKSYVNVKKIALMEYFRYSIIFLKWV